MLPYGAHRGKASKADYATLEHLALRSNGGKDEMGNLAMACRECNAGRGTVDWLTYTAYKRGEIE